VSSSTGRWRRAARDGARRGQGAFIRGSARPWVTRGDDGDARRATAARGSRVRQRRRRRTAGPWRARVRQRSSADSAHLGAGRRVGALVGSVGARLGPDAASGGVGARRRGARRSGSNPFTSANFEIEKL
jgi:hypothetical protein